MATRRKYYGIIGDQSPIEHWGGIVYDQGYGPQVTYFQSYDDDKVSIYTFNVEDDVVADLDWADWAGVASFSGMDVAELKKYGRSKNLLARAQVYETVAGYHGFGELDPYPEETTIAKAERQWGRAVDAAHRAASKRRSNPAVTIKRKGYTTKRGTHVKPTRFKMQDKGRPGVRSFGAKSATGKYAKRAHMKPLITHEGSLGGPGYTKKAAKTRHALLTKCVKQDGYRSCLGKLQVLLMSSELKAPTRKVLESDKKWLMSKFGGPGSFRKTTRKKSSRKKNPGKVSVRSLVAKALK